MHLLLSPSIPKASKPQLQILALEGREKGNFSQQTQSTLKPEI
jgi:hypothetical protein